MRKILFLSIIVMVTNTGIGRADDFFDPRAVEVVKAAREALGTPAAVRLEVRTVGGYELAQGTPKIPGRSTVLFAAGEPSRLDARLKGIDGAVHEVAVSNGEGTVFSSGGELSELPKDAFFPQGAMGDAYVAAPWFVNPRRLADLTAKGSLVYAGRTEVGGEPCDMLVHISRDSKPTNQVVRSTYLWFSTRTHLPQSVQSYGIYNGAASVSERRTFSGIELLAQVPPGAFEAKPKAADTVARPKPVTTQDDESGGRLRSLVGKPVPDAGLVDYPSSPTTLHKVLELEGDQASRPLTLLTFWATWCGPCVGEMPSFQKLVDERKGRLRVVAVANGDSREAAEAYIKEHPEQAFHFTHSLDGDVLGETFGIAGLPTNLLIDGSGKVVDAWLGSRPDEQTAAKIDEMLQATEKKN